LHYAAQLGRHEICKALVKEGAILTIIEEVRIYKEQRTGGAQRRSYTRDHLPLQHNN